MLRCGLYVLASSSLKEDKKNDGRYKFTTSSSISLRKNKKILGSSLKCMHKETAMHMNTRLYTLA